MDCLNIVDWLSVKVKVDLDNIENVYAVEAMAWESLTWLFGKSWVTLSKEIGSTWEQRRGRSPYDISFYTPKGFTVFVNRDLDHLLLECSGKGCQLIARLGLQKHILTKSQATATRIDFATDIETDILPTVFVDAGVTGAFKSRGIIKSTSGETVYVGSKKSARYCRVYRYNEPHERAKYLRIEYVYRKDEAKSAVKRMLSVGIDEFAKGSATLYQWGHPIMKEEKSLIDMSSYRPERRSGKTLLWIIAQVAPAFKKLVKEGVIENPQEFLDKHFLKEKGE